VFDVYRNPAAARDLESEDVAVESRGRVLVVAFEGAVGERLRHVAASGKLGFGQLALPVGARDRAPLGRGLRVVVLDLERVPSGSPK